ncbi:MAG: 30S ribosomal protein S11 [Chitinophagales bacterium]|nr:30S ribosomal protein S11 [Chitinophagales bacterium]MDW8394314.1 30S ribosomal protein S11 [Chitinophagales bacterium]
MAESKKTAKKKTVKADPEGYAYIQASFNNMIITFTNRNGNTLTWSSAGKAGFKGSKKNTPYAAQVAAQEAAKAAHDLGVRRVEVFVKGPGAGREAAIRAIHTQGIEVTVIRDITPLPHNGCRPPKRRRV